VSGLSERVDASVGAAGPVDNDVLFGDFARRVIEGALDRRQGGLKLPAVEGGALVSDCELNVTHA
jgi:hypothetical protein